MKLRILTSDVQPVSRNCQAAQQWQLTYEQWTEFKELGELRSNGRIRFCLSDKGLEFVVMPQSTDHGSICGIRRFTRTPLRMGLVYNAGALTTYG